LRCKQPLEGSCFDKDENLGNQRERTVCAGKMPLPQKTKAKKQTQEDKKKTKETITFPKKHES